MFRVRPSTHEQRKENHHVNFRRTLFQNQQRYLLLRPKLPGVGGVRLPALPRREQGPLLAQYADHRRGLQLLQHNGPQSGRRAGAAGIHPQGTYAADRKGRRRQCNNTYYLLDLPPLPGPRDKLTYHEVGAEDAGDRCTA